jgi:hypothetical protein
MVGLLRKDRVEEELVQFVSVVQLKRSPGLFFIVISMVLFADILLIVALDNCLAFVINLLLLFSFLFLDLGENDFS